MSESQKANTVSTHIAEEILRTIYGDDFKGCRVSLDEIAAIVSAGLNQANSQNEELLDLYEKLVEALDLLSRPPEAGKVTDPNELRSLLSERLDAIHALTTKTIETVARVKKKRATPPE